MLLQMAASSPGRVFAYLSRSGFLVCLLEDQVYMSKSRYTLHCSAGWGCLMGSNKIGLYRLRRGISLSQLAGAVGVSRQSLYAIEAGEQVPKVYLALSIARVLGAEVTDLFPGEPSATYRVDVQSHPPGVFRACLAEIEGDTVIRQSLSAGFGSAAVPADAVVRRDGSNFEVECELGRSGLFIDGCDPALGIISTRSAESSNSFRVRWFYGSNKDSMEKLTNRLTHCALVHGESDDIADGIGESNGVVVPFGQWELALCFAPGNPKMILSLADIVRADVKFAWREDGSGVRHFLDRALTKLGYDIAGLATPATFHDHYQVAAAVGLGLCDAGVVPVSIAQSQGLGHIPVGSHQSSLVFSKDGYDVALAANKSHLRLYRASG